MRHTEPLEPNLWFAALRKLRNWAGGAVGSEQERLVRHAFHLCQLTPRPLAGIVRPAFAEDEFEGLLADGDFERAARGLIAAPMVLEVATDKNGRFHASVSLPGQARVTVECSQSVMAVVAAWAQYLIELRERAAPSG